MIGIAGGPEKCEWLTGELGLDAAIDYKSEDVKPRLRELCPKGSTCSGTTSGATTLEAGLANLAMHARVVLCGAIANYNATPDRAPQLHEPAGEALGMEGFVVFDYLPRAGEALAELTPMVEGTLQHREDVREGLEGRPRR